MFVWLGLLVTNQTSGQVLTLLLSVCVTLGKLHQLSEPPILICKIEIMKAILLKVVWELGVV